MRLFKKIGCVVLICILTIQIVFATQSIQDTIVKEIDKVVVEDVNGAPSVVIKYQDGTDEIYADIPYTNFDATTTQIQEMIDSGFESFCFAVRLDDFKGYGVWQGIDEDGNNILDFTNMDAKFDFIVSHLPNAKIILRYEISSFPEWWVLQNPEERTMFMDEEGKIKPYAADWEFTHNPGLDPATKDQYYVGGDINTRISSCSNKWMNESLKVWKQYTAHILENWGNNFLGGFLMGLGTGEFYYSSWPVLAGGVQDYNAGMLEGFKNYIKNTYKSENELRKAWNKEDNFGFNDVKLPDANRRIDNTTKLTIRDPEKNKDLIDFYRFYNENIVDHILYFANGFKKFMPERLCGALYGFMFEFHGYPETGCNALEKLVKSDSIDIIQNTASYSNRYPGIGGEALRGPQHTVNLNGKVWWQDNDIVTYLYDFNPNGDIEKEKEWAISNLGYTETKELSLDMFKRVTGYAIANSQYLTNMDLHYKYYGDKWLRSGMKRLEDLFKESLQGDRSSAAEILVIYDERSNDYLTHRGLAAGRLSTNLQMQQMMKIGAPYDTILINDLDKVDMDQYRLVFFANTIHMTDKQRELAQKVKSNSRTVVWGWMPGYINGNVESLDAVKQLTGIELNQIPTTAYSTLITKQDEFLKNEYPLFNLNDRLLQCFNKTGAINFDDYKDNRGTSRLYSPVGKDIIPLAIKQAPLENLTSGYKYIKTGNNDGFYSVYMPTSYMSVEAWQALAEFSGVTLYRDTYGMDNDTIYASNKYVTIHANGDGKRTLNLPYEADIYDAFDNNKLIATKVSNIELNMKDKTTHIFKVDYKYGMPKTPNDSGKNNKPSVPTPPTGDTNIICISGLAILSIMLIILRLKCKQ